MHTEPRNGPVTLLVVHVNVGPEVEGGAQGLASYLHTIDAGYHAVHDDRQTIVTAPDDQVVWGAGGVNHRAIHSCIIGQADQTAAQWHDSYSMKAIHNAAVWATAKCRAYGLPPVRLTPAQIAGGGAKGLCGHVDVSADYAASEGHYDPGPNFAWDIYLASVRQLHNPLVFILPRPGGGAWWAHADGTVDFIGANGTVLHGGMVSPSDRRAFTGRTVKRLTPRTYRHLRRKRAGYSIVATSGEHYIPSAQH